MADGASVGVDDRTDVVGESVGPEVMIGSAVEGAFDGAVEGVNVDFEGATVGVNVDGAAEHWPCANTLPVGQSLVLSGHSSCSFFPVGTQQQIREKPALPFAAMVSAQISLATSACLLPTNLHTPCALEYAGGVASFIAVA